MPTSARRPGVVDGPLLIVAGPGSGKTRTLTHRIAHLVAERGVAARELPRHHLHPPRRRRNARAPCRRSSAPRGQGRDSHLPFARPRHPARACRAPPGSTTAFASPAKPSARRCSPRRSISARKGRAAPARHLPGEAHAELAGADVRRSADGLRRAMARHNWIDFDDLVALSVRAADADARSRRALSPPLAMRSPSTSSRTSTSSNTGCSRCWRRRRTAIFASSAIPTRRSTAFAAPMRPASSASGRIIPGAETVRLTRNYRSSGTIVTASSQVIAPRPNEPIAEIVREMHERIAIHTAPTERAEAEFVVRRSSSMIGGHSFFSIDSGRAGLGAQSGGHSPTLPCSTAPTPSRRAARGPRPFRHSLSAALPCHRSPTSRPYGALLQELGDGSAATTLADDCARPPERLAERRRGRDRGDARCSASPRSPSGAATIARASRTRSRSPPTRSSGMRAPTACRC